MKKEVVKMKRALSLVIALVFVVTMTAPSFALPEPVDKSLHKIKKGVWDIASIPYDLGKGTYDEAKSSSFKPFGLLGGVLKSSAEGVKKAVTSAVDIATFPLDMVKK